VSTSVLIEVIGLILGGGGGGAVVSKVTRLVVSVEALVKQIETVVADARAVADQMRELDARVSRLEGAAGPGPSVPR
jgi:hypothetical protein